jgi:hypothetical protein
MKPPRLVMMLSPFAATYFLLPFGLKTGPDCLPEAHRLKQAQRILYILRQS